MIAPRLIEWQRAHGRHDLPWQGSRDAYRIWLSEIMLQQTRVATVLPYYRRFVERFADVHALACADLDAVLALWSGLGYYGRARNLHRCAREIVEHHGGAFPRDPARLAALPGIGRSTAAAIAVFAFGERAAILDGNVRRVLCRHAGVHGSPAQRAVADELWRIAERELPREGLEAYTQGLMDLGATVCTRTRAACDRCPLAGDCVALREGSVNEIPAPAPRRALPHRRCTLYVIRRNAEVLLEKRAAHGIWGGLWSLPEGAAPPDAVHAAGLEAAVQVAEHAERVVGEIEARFALRARPRARLPAIEHVFTHFRLSAVPLLLDCEGACGVAEGDALRWLPIPDAGDAALPSPVKSLLLRLGAADAAADADAVAGPSGP